MLTGLHYEGTTVNRTFLVRKFDHFFLILEDFRALLLHARELVFILLLPRILPDQTVLELEDCLYQSRHKGRSKRVGQQLRINMLPPSKGYTYR